jgi:hypothetical protein
MLLIVIVGLVAGAYALSQRSAFSQDYGSGTPMVIAGPPAAAAGTTQIFCSGSEDAVPAAANYNLLSAVGNQSNSTTQTSRRQLIAAPGTIRGMRVKTSAVLGAGQQRSFTLVLNDSNSALGCNIGQGAGDSPDPNQYCQADTPITVAKKDTVSVRMGPVAGTVTAKPRWSFKWIGDNANESLLLGAFSGGSARWVAFSGRSSNRTHCDGTAIVFSEAGTLKTLCGKMDSVDATGSHTIFTQDGADDLDTSPLITCTIATSADPPECCDDTNELTIAEGDRICVKQTDTGANRNIAIGAVFVPTESGRFLLPGITTGGNPSNSVEEYAAFTYGVENPDTTQEDHDSLCQAMTLKKLCTWQYVAPGVDNAWTITVQKDTGTPTDTALKTIIQGASEVEECVSTDVSVSDDDFLRLTFDPQGTIPDDTGIYHTVSATVP